MILYSKYKKEGGFLMSEQLDLILIKKRYSKIKFCYAFSVASCFTAFISAGAYLSETKFSLCNHINFECSFAVGAPDVMRHFIVIKFTVNLSYS